MRSVVAAMMVAVLAAGCSPEKVEDAPRGRGRNRGPQVGATDSAFRRAGGAPTENVFAPLDLPDANERRLGSGAPGPDYWQQQVDYAIDATLDAETQHLTAEMTVTYHNNSPHELTYIWIQLEQNLFRADSIGTVSRTPGSVMKQLEGNFMGGFDLSAVMAGDVELDISVYGTLARVELAQPIASGENFEFSLDFEFDMPPHLRRMGSEKVDQGTIFEYAQWFPHVCNYDDINGWNTLPYLGTGEFYTNFGDYAVNLTVPREFIVYGTGELQNPEEVLTYTQQRRLEEAAVSDEPVMVIFAGEIGEESSRPAGDGPLTWKFKAENVRTFAWATSDAFMWDACKADVTDLDGTTRTVLCQSLYPAEATAWLPEHSNGGSTNAIKHAIEFYSDWLYPYPYPHMTNINGPEGGMEYPMMIFCGGRSGERGPAGVTDHEAGHSWFPMIINSDERRHVWMDEGFNSFINLYSRAHLNDTDVRDGRGRGQPMRVDLSENPQPVSTRPDVMWSRWVGSLGYRKPATALSLLREEVLGPERFDRAFSEYCRRWAFKSPQPADFFRTMEDAAGVDLAWFWRGWINTTSRLDQSVTAVEHTDTAVIVELTNLEAMVMPVTLDLEFDDGTNERHKLPVEIWFSTDQWRAVFLTNGRQVVAVTVDPDEQMPDSDRENNVWVAPEL